MQVEVTNTVQLTDQQVREIAERHFKENPPKNSELVGHAVNRHEMLNEIVEFILKNGTETREICGEQVITIVPLPSYKKASERNQAWAAAIRDKFAA